MNLTRYIAKWGWTSLFVLTWIKVMNWWVGPPEVLFGAYCVFGGITALSTGLYVFGLWRMHHLMKKGYWVPYE